MERERGRRRQAGGGEGGAEQRADAAVRGVHRGLAGRRDGRGQAGFIRCWGFTGGVGGQPHPRSSSWLGVRLCHVP